MHAVKWRLNRQFRELFATDAGRCVTILFIQATHGNSGEKLLKTNFIKNISRR
jgi:hypothetical protein